MSRRRRTPEQARTEILDAARSHLAPGGALVYATCSPHLRETSGVVETVIGERDDVTVESTHQWWPHVDGTDAMFCAVLRRTPSPGR